WRHISPICAVRGCLTDRAIAPMRVDRWKGDWGDDDTEQGIRVLPPGFPAEQPDDPEEQCPGAGDVQAGDARKAGLRARPWTSRLYAAAGLAQWLDRPEQAARRPADVRRKGRQARWRRL